MKKFLTIAVLVAAVFICGIARAEVHSTEDNFAVAMMAAMTAINATDDYFELMSNAPYDVVAQRRQDCERHLSVLKIFMDETAQGKESLNCTLLAMIIMQERGMTLQYFLDTMSAYRSGNQSLFEQYKEETRKMFRQAEESRQEFRNTYGK